MKTAWLQHVPFEGPGLIADWMAARQFSFPRIALWAGEPLPDPQTLDLLVVMGGPMNVDETDAYPWLTAERVFIRRAIDAGVRVVGICLGAQLIARALGARVYRGPQPEIGWCPVTRTAATHPVCDGLPVSFQAYHWHGDTFELPDGATCIAGSALYANQVFIWGERVLGLQCHLETTPRSAQDIIDHTTFEPGPTVQSAEAMLADTARFETLRPILFDLLDRLVAT